MPGIVHPEVVFLPRISDQAVCASPSGLTPAVRLNTTHPSGKATAAVSLIIYSGHTQFKFDW